ncbi:MAG: T9SS type A sorting domain-containing protein, partial [Bacteroidota bacterium]
ETTISFRVPTQSSVSLKVFDSLGREVAALLSEQLSAGTYERQWDATGLGSGVYFYQLCAGSFVETKKLLLLK